MTVIFLTMAGIVLENKVINNGVKFAYKKFVPKSNIQLYNT